jgi:hypothetical protein
VPSRFKKKDLATMTVIVEGISQMAMWGGVRPEWHFTQTAPGAVSGIPQTTTVVVSGIPQTAMLAVLRTSALAMGRVVLADTT